MERVNTNPDIIHFIVKRNKYFPGSRLPVLIYRNTLYLPLQKNKASIIVQKLFARNGWTNSWRDGIYNFHHYHSITHEVLAVSMGSVKVQLGGHNGRKINAKQGDVIILPAGIAHKCVSASKDFLCIGAYPQGKDYDINVGLKLEYKPALNNINKLSLPQKDPVFGNHGFLKVYWKKIPG